MHESIGRVTEEMVLFWNGPFSQWYPSEFEINGIQYNCCEQYMMAEKARLFGDEDTLKEIMETDSPREQKKLGRQVSDFDQSKWEEIAQEVVYQGNLAKFSQNPDLKEILFSTQDKILVEASPYDKIWGIGLSADDPRAEDRSQWLGTNWLGEALSQVRSDLAQHE
jgi:ribA/ribD-fused uncharacterized protein